MADGISLAAQNQVALAKLRVATENSGLSWQKLGGHVIEAQDKLSGLSGFVNTDLETSLSQLLSTTGHVGSAMRLQSMAMDLARARGLSLGQASTIMSKAFHGSTTSLQRLGISLSSTASRQEILAKLNEKFGGSWRAYGSTASGALSRIRAVADQLLERLGKQALPFLQRFAAWFAEHLPQIEAGATRVFTAISTGIQTLINVGQGLISFYQKWGVYVQAAAVAVGILTVALEVYVGWTAIVTKATKAWAVAQGILNAILDANPVAIVVLALAALAALFVVLWHRSSTFRSIVRTTFSVAASAARVAGSVISAVWQRVQAVAGAAISFIMAHWRVFVALIPGIGIPILFVIKHFQTFKSVAQTAISLAIRLWNNLKGPISAVAGWIQTVIDKVQQLIGWISKIHFPHIPGSGPLSSAGGFLGIASGGVVTKPTFAMVGEAGPEAVIPLRHLDRYLGGGGLQVHLHAGTMIGSSREFEAAVANAVTQAMRSGRQVGYGGRLAVR